MLRSKRDDSASWKRRTASGTLGRSLERTFGPIGDSGDAGFAYDQSLGIVRYRLNHRGPRAIADAVASARHR